MRQFLTLAIALLMGLSAKGQGMEFFHGSWPEALNEAGKQGKLIFVDAYTTWCGPCKRMSMYVFPDPEVGEFYNANFINMKLDMEKGEGLEFRRKYPVQAFPTFFFIDSKGEVVHTTKGAKQAPEFIALGESALSKYDGSIEYEKRYQEGDRDFDLVYTYVKELNKAGKPSLKISNDYLNSKPEITDKQRAQFLLEAAIQVDSRLFEMLEEEKKAVIAATGEEAFLQGVRRAADQTVLRGKQYESRKLVQLAIDVLEKYQPAEAERFAMLSWMEYALEMRDKPLYLDNGKDFVKKSTDKDAGLLQQIAEDVMKNYPEDKEMLELAEKAMAKSLKSSPSSGAYASFAGILHRKGEKDRALEAVNEGINFAEKEGQSDRLLQALKRMIENS